MNRTYGTFKSLLSGCRRLSLDTGFACRKHMIGQQPSTGAPVLCDATVLIAGIPL
jgi:hypothetical protein